MFKAGPFLIQGEQVLCMFKAGPNLIHGEQLLECLRQALS